MVAASVRLLPAPVPAAGFDSPNRIRAALAAAAGCACFSCCWFAAQSSGFLVLQFVHYVSSSPLEMAQGLPWSLSTDGNDGYDDDGYGDDDDVDGNWSLTKASAVAVEIVLAVIMTVGSLQQRLMLMTMMTLVTMTKRKHRSSWILDTWLRSTQFARVRPRQLDHLW